MKQPRRLTVWNPMVAPEHAPDLQEATRLALRWALDHHNESLVTLDEYDPTTGDAHAVSTVSRIRGSKFDDFGFIKTKEVN